MLIYAVACLLQTLFFASHSFNYLTLGVRLASAFLMHIINFKLDNNCDCLQLAPYLTGVSILNRQLFSHKLTNFPRCLEIEACTYLYLISNCLKESLLICSGSVQPSSHPTGSFTIIEPQDQEIGEFYEVQKRCATDFEAPKL